MKTQYILYNTKKKCLVEEVECIAGWKEGSYRFLVGRVHHSNGIPMSTEDRFKCFIYERTTSQRQLKGSSTSGDVEYRVAQSGDATCSGLFSPLEGSRTMILKKGTSLSIVVMLILSMNYLVVDKHIILLKFN